MDPIAPSDGLVLGMRFLGITLLLIGNLLAYRARKHLQKKGYQVSRLVANPFKDYVTIKKAIDGEEDPVKNKKLKRSFLGLKVMFVIFPVALAAFFSPDFLGWIP